MIGVPNVPRLVDIRLICDYIRGSIPDVPALTIFDLPGRLRTLLVGGRGGLQDIALVCGELKKKMLTAQSKKPVARTSVRAATVYGDVVEPSQIISVMC